MNTVCSYVDNLYEPYHNNKEISQKADSSYLWYRYGISIVHLYLYFFILYHYIVLLLYIIIRP